MFKSSGEKNFNRCHHYNVQTNELPDGTILAAQLDCPQTQDEDIEIKVQARNVSRTKGYGTAEGTKDIEVKSADGKWLREDSAFLSLSAATTYLGKEAMSLVCSDCPYSKMSALEVSDVRASRAEEKLALAHNELRRLQATDALADAYRQIERIEQQAAPPVSPQ